MKKFTLWCTGEPAREHALNALYIAMHCSNIVNITVHSESNLYAVCEFLDPNLALLAKQWFFHNSTINSKYIYESIFIYTLYLYTIYSCCFYAASMYSYQGNLTWIYTWSYLSLNGFNWIHWPSLRTSILAWHGFIWIEANADFSWSPFTFCNELDFAMQRSNEITQTNTEKDTGKYKKIIKLVFLAALVMCTRVVLVSQIWKFCFFVLMQCWNQIFSPLRLYFWHKKYTKSVLCLAYDEGIKGLLCYDRAAFEFKKSFQSLNLTFHCPSDHKLGQSPKVWW